LRAAALLRTAAPDAAEPRAAFVAEMRQRLLNGGMPAQVGGNRDPNAGQADPVPSTGGARFSRRGILRQSATIAAAAAAGIAAGAIADHAIANANQPGTSDHWDVPLVTNGTWVAVAAENAFSLGTVRRFTTEYAVGYLRLTSAGFVALSAACTHMGCLVAWNESGQTFDCPCHSGRFNADGTAAKNNRVAYKPLPKLDTKVESGQVWVFVPHDPSGSSDSTPSSAPTQNPKYTPDVC
jgi:Rieske Fe-S protein